MKKPTKRNVLRALAYPVVKAIPSMRMLIVVIAEKISETKPKAVARW